MISSKLREVLSAVLPITIIVMILNFTLAPLAAPLLIRFLLGAFLIVLGLTFFLFGVDIGITPIGNVLGSTIVKKNKIWIVAAAGLVLGFIISIAEPDLHILASQVEFVTKGLVMKWEIVVIVSIGIAILLSLGLIRIIRNIPLYKVLSVLYLIIFALAIFTSPEFLAISFDASGATTGAMTVPFILALATGISAMKKDSKASEKDSFGLVAIASTGAIIAVMLMSIFAKTDRIAGEMVLSQAVTPSILSPFLLKLPIIAGEVIVALIPILLIFFIFQKVSFKLSKRTFWKILFGLLFVFIGLTLFLVGVNAGFLEVGRVVGYKIASLENKAIIVLVGFILGFVTILAEPAVYVLTRQIEEVTSGYVRRKVVMLSLAIGVGIAVALSMLKIIIPALKLWHYLLPGYIIAIAMMYFVPKLFIGIAFDSGGVASGPMTATFILAFAQGAASAIDGANVLVDGFGLIAMVALTPLIALQILGFMFKLKSKKQGVEESAR